MEKLVITKSTHASEYLQLGLRPEHRADIKLIYKKIYLSFTWTMLLSLCIVGCISVLFISVTPL